MIAGPSAEQLAELGEPSDELIGALARAVISIGHHGHQTAQDYIQAMSGEDAILAHNLLVDVDELLRERWELAGAPKPHLLRSNA